MMPLRTSTRLALSYILLLLLTGGALTLLLGGEFERIEESALRARLTDQARAVAYEAAPFFAQADPTTPAQRLAVDMSRLFGTRVTIIRIDGVVVGDSDEDPASMENHAGRPEVAQVIANPGAVGSNSRLSATVERRLLYVAVAIGSPAVGVARVAYPMTAVEEARNALWRSLVLTALLVSVPIALLSLWLARSLTGPLTVLQRAASRLGRGDLSARYRAPASGEIGELAREYNAMADRLSSAIGELTGQRNQMAAVLEHMYDGIIVTNSHGMIESLNSAAARLLETSGNKVVGRSIIEISGSHELFTGVRSALSTRGEVEPRRLDISIGGRGLSALVTVVPAPEGEPARGLVVLQDVTELRRLERARRDFVTNIGHELRTPLASIKLLVETLETARDDPEASQDFLRRIDTEVDGLTQLVRELLELSRIESGQVELRLDPVDIGKLLERTASRLRAQAERSGLRLTVEAPEDLPPAYADAERIEQVLVNLLHNAIKFTDPGGSVALAAEVEGANIRISVRDTGVGIAPDDLARIFERFYKVDKGRNREGGTGLGLAIARHVVQAHNGRIWAESKSGTGSTFYFTLPIAPSAD